MALNVSSKVGGLSSSFITGLCSTSALPTSDIIEQRLRSWSKYCAHLYVMRVGSLTTVFPSGSKNGLQSLDDGSYTVFRPRPHVSGNL